MGMGMGMWMWMRMGKRVSQPLTNRTTMSRWSGRNIRPPLECLIYGNFLQLTESSVEIRESIAEDICRRFHQWLPVKRKAERFSDGFRKRQKSYFDWFCL